MHEALLLVVEVSGDYLAELSPRIQERLIGAEQHAIRPDLSH